MNSKHWESSYRRASGQLHTPTPLDEKVLSRARAAQPARKLGRQTGRLLSKAASGLSAIAIAIVLLHPAQYIGATPGQISPQNNSRELGLERYRTKMEQQQARKDTWYTLRAEVNAGNYMALCAQWRKQQRASGDKPLPADLAAKARQHCRILP